MDSLISSFLFFYDSINTFNISSRFLAIPDLVGYREEPSAFMEPYFAAFSGGIPMLYEASIALLVHT